MNIVYTIHAGADIAFSRRCSKVFLSMKAVGSGFRDPFETPEMLQGHRVTLDRQASRGTTGTVDTPNIKHEQRLMICAKGSNPTLHRENLNEVCCSLDLGKVFVFYCRDICLFLIHWILDMLQDILHFLENQTSI